MSSDYILEFRSIDPSRRYCADSDRQEFIRGFNKNVLINAGDDIPQDSLDKLKDGFGEDDKLTFVIEPYQRGFRWDADENVKELLVDLFEYSKKHSSLFDKTDITYSEGLRDDDFDFYCLQTLTVKALVGNGCWEVIDGQQRLTCMFLIYTVLSYFCGPVFTPYKIIYHREEKNFEFSKKIEDYFKELSEGDTPARDILSTNDADEKERWFNDKIDKIERLFDREECNQGSYIIDSYYIRSALIKIFKFVSDKRTQKMINTLFECVKRNVYFLWYVVPDDSGLRSEDVFLKINSGAIPLTNAELIKSLVLRSNSKEDKSDEKNSKEDKSDVKNRSRKWETIEQGLSVDELWSFIAGDYNPDTRVDLLLDIYARRNEDKDNPYLENSANNPYALFDWYSEYCTRFSGDYAKFAKNVLDGIQDIFDRVLEWFDDVEIYHYIGLLTVYQTLGFRFNNTYKNQQEMLKELLIEAEKEASSKEDFVNKLKQKVVLCLKSGLKKNQIPEHARQLIEDSDTYNNDFVNYNDNDGKKRVEAILWLFNVYETIESTDNKTESGNKKGEYTYKNNICRRFPFSEALSRRWSLEHIFPQHPDENDKESLKRYNDEIDKLEEDAKSEERKDARIKEDDIHFICNLALLDNKTNTALQNEMLFKKRRKLIEKIGKGKFVPCSTINAFMLYYNISASNVSDYEKNPRGNDVDWNYWTRDDADNYEQAIIRCLKAVEGENE